METCVEKEEISLTKKGISQKQTLLKLNKQKGLEVAEEDQIAHMPYGKGIMINRHNLDRQ